MQHAHKNSTRDPAPSDRQDATRRYSAHLRGQPGRQTIDGADSFAEAALLFAENVSHDGEVEDLTVVVTEAETGNTECFVVALHTHEVKPC